MLRQRLAVALICALPLAACGAKTKIVTVKVPVSGPTIYKVPSHCYADINNYEVAVHDYQNAADSVTGIPRTFDLRNQTTLEAQIAKWNVQIGKMDALAANISADESGVSDCALGR